jgi:hypothetical protein
MSTAARRRLMRDFKVRHRDAELAATTATASQKVLG